MRERSVPGSVATPRRLSIIAAVALVCALGLAIGYVADQISMPWLRPVAGAVMAGAALVGLVALSWNVIKALKKEIDDAFRLGLRPVGRPAWVERVPFSPKIVGALYLSVFAPLVVSGESAIKGDWFDAVLFAGIWLLAFPIAAVIFHRHDLVSLRTSAVAVILAITCYAAALLRFTNV